MKRTVSLVVVMLSFTILIGARISIAAAAPRFEVTVTNLTRGQQFTPILVASHEPHVRLFMLGDPAISELSTLAEEGNTGPLSGLLSAMPQVRDVITSSGLLDPGKSVTIIVRGGG